MITSAHWAKWTEWPLAAAAVAFLAAYAVPILRPDLPDPWSRVCAVTVAVTWVLFAVDFVVRVALADHRRRYVTRHVPDLLMIALPLLRPLRLLRLVLLLRMLNRRAAVSLRGKVAVYVTGGTILLAFCGSLAVLSAERGAPGATIRSFGDALWWAAATMSTVGYGDVYPVTDTGRLTAVVLMIGGVSLIGIITAGLASWLVQHLSTTDQQTADLQTEVAELRTEIAALTRELATRHGPRTG